MKQEARRKMNDWKLALENLDALIKETGTNLPLAGRSGVYAAVRIILTDLTSHIVAERSDAHGAAIEHGYANEQIAKIKWHVGAALGFDVDNGHDASQHRSWAYGALGTFVAEREIGVEGPIREHYLVGFLDTADQSLHRTEVCWPVFHTKGA